MKKRKIRKDAKRSKTGRLVKYVPKRDKNDAIKLWWWKRVEMPNESLMRWARHLRPTIKRKITLFGIRFDAYPTQIDTKAKILAIAEEMNDSPGEYLLMGWCHRKNKFGVSPMPMCRIMISETREGLRARWLKSERIFRYWFWKG